MKTWSDAKRLEKQSEFAKKRHEDPVFKAQVTANVKRYWADPANREAVQARERQRCADPDIRAKRSARAKEMLHDPAFKAQIDQSRQVEIEGVVYPHMKAAAEAVGLTYITLRKRVESDQYPTWIDLSRKDSTVNKQPTAHAVS